MVATPDLAMPWLAEIQENVRFLIAEVIRQVEDASLALRDPSANVDEEVQARDDYIDTLKAVIENKCFARLYDRDSPTRARRDLLHAIAIVTANLENIADLSAHIVSQLRFLPDRQATLQFPAAEWFDTILEALGSVADSLFSRQLSVALRICRAEFEIDRRYEVRFNEFLDRLRAGSDPAETVTLINIFRNLEEIADKLLNVGEAIILSISGEKMKVHQYHALGEALDIHDDDNLEESLKRFESIWGSRSGCRIGRMPMNATPPSGNAESPTRWVIFKEGKTRKLAKERQSIEMWDKLVPGLPPRVLGFHDHGENASILLEFLPGATLQSILLDGTTELIAGAWGRITATLADVYRRTREEKPVPMVFISQLQSRLGDVLQMHPEFNAPPQQIGDLVVPSFRGMVDELARRTTDLVAPFSVVIHGDMNLDNVLYEVASDTLHVIDLHRAAHADWVQDVSVFMVSHFRLRAFDVPLRGKINQVLAEVMEFARRVAREHNDTTAEARLAIGLVRSFFTSTRFELEREFSHAMFRRSIYLLSRLLAHDGGWDTFRLPGGTLAY